VAFVAASALGGGILHAEVLELKGDCGHLETGCDKDEAAPKVKAFWVIDHLSSPFRAKNIYSG
jgi:hypothetical protein